MKFLTTPYIIGLLKDYISNAEALQSDITENLKDSNKNFNEALTDATKIEADALEKIKDKEELEIVRSLSALATDRYVSDVNTFISTYVGSDDDLNSDFSIGEIMFGEDYNTQAKKPISNSDVHPQEWEDYNKQLDQYVSIIRSQKSDYQRDFDEFNKETLTKVVKSFELQSEGRSEELKIFAKEMREKLGNLGDNARDVALAKGIDSWASSKVKDLISDYELNQAFNAEKIQDNNRQIIIDNGQVEYPTKGFYPSLDEGGEPGSTWRVYLDNMAAGNVMMQDSIASFMQVGDQAEKIKSLIEKSTDEGQVNHGLMPTADDLRVKSKMALWSYRNIAPEMEAAALKGLTSITYSSSAVSIYTIWALQERGYNVFQGPINDQTGLYESIVIDWSTSQEANK